MPMSLSCLNPLNYTYHLLLHTVLPWQANRDAALPLCCDAIVLLSAAAHLHIAANKYNHIQYVSGHCDSNITINT